MTDKCLCQRGAHRIGLNNKKSYLIGFGLNSVLNLSLPSSTIAKQTVLKRLVMGLTYIYQKKGIIGSISKCGDCKMKLNGVSRSVFNLEFRSV